MLVWGTDCDVTHSWACFNTHGTERPSDRVTDHSAIWTYIAWDDGVARSDGPSFFLKLRPGLDLKYISSNI